MPDGVLPDNPPEGTAPVRALPAIVGRRHVLTGEARSRRYRSGYRTGGGAALAVVRPGSLLEQWRVVQACVAPDFLCHVLHQDYVVRKGVDPVALEARMRRRSTMSGSCITPRRRSPRITGRSTPATASTRASGRQQAAPPRRAGRG